MRKSFVGLVLPLIALALIFLGGAFWWGSSCKIVEQKVDSGEFRVEKIGDGWFISAEPGFGQTSEYLNLFAGLLAKRTSRNSSGREIFKLAGACGGSATVGYWASNKGLGPDGKKLPRVTWPAWPVPGDRGRLSGDRGGPVFEFAIGGLLILGVVVMVRLHHRRPAAFG